MVPRLPAEVSEANLRQFQWYSPRLSWTFQSESTSWPNIATPPYRAIGHSYTYRIYVFQGIAGYRAIPRFLGRVSRNYVDVLKARGGGVSQAKAALSAIGRYRGYRSYTVANRGLMGH